MGTYVGLSEYNKGLGLSVFVQFKAKLYPFSVLKAARVVNDHFNGKDILVYYSMKEHSATAWLRTVNGQSLTFEATQQTDPHGNMLLRDEQTQSLWSWLRGEAVEGELKGQQLAQLSYNPILNDRFHAFYPDGPVYR